MLSYQTAGESHGKYLVALIQGLPAGLSVNLNLIKSELKRRRDCIGRSKRSQSEPDRFEIVTGLRKGKTIGAPLTILIPNKKPKTDSMPPLTRLRPGHIDIAAAAKFGAKDVRDFTERASARETAVRVAAGAIAKMLLAEFGIEIAGYVNEIGGVMLCPLFPSFNNAAELRRRLIPEIYGLDKEACLQAIKKINEAGRKGDTLGGIFTVVGFNVPAGLGSHSQWNLRIDSRLAAAVMAIPAVKGVELGLGFGYSRVAGTGAHDLIYFNGNKPLFNKGGGLKRVTDNAGGIEGGITNGENIIIRAAVKPVPTLGKPLKTIDLATGKTSRARVESADICAAAPALVVAESAAAFELARAFLDKFGGDTVSQIKRHFGSA
ncbi:MAG: chorismate synthase [Planctomycetes bacterium]|nr:chorismate synthase [Planctomycetota bacterium]